MKQFLLKKSLIIFALLLTPLITSNCEGNEDMQDKEGWVKVCTEWGASSAKIRNLMKTYSQLYSSSGLIVYKGKGDSDAISYKFVNDSLCATVVLVKSIHTTPSIIRKTFSGYESLGEFNSNELLIDGDQLITIKEYLKEDMSYIAVGYIPFKTNE